MEVLQYQLGRSAGTNLHDANVRSIGNTKLWVGRSVNSPSLYSNYNYYETSRERSLVKNYETLRERSVVKKKKSMSWWNDPERKRKRRVARYKFYGTEGKLKRSLKKGFQWLKVKCIKISASF